MKRKKIYRVVSALLILTISACDLSDYVKANSSNIVETTEEVESNEFENEQISVEDSIQDVSKEDQVIDKTLNTTTFEGEDGKKELVMHGYNVRYKDDEGQLIDYDPSLVKVQNQETDAGTELEGYVYENKDGDCKHYIPETLTEDTPILMEKNDYQISFRPIFDREEIPIKVEDSTAQIIEQQKVDVDSSEKEKTSKKEKSNQKEAETVTISAESINSDELEEVEVSEEKVVNIYEDEVSIDNTASYTVEDNSTELQYISQENGIKENVVLQKCPENNVFSYELKIPGLIPELSEETKEVILYDNDGKAIGLIDAPNMNDASEDAYSEDITYQIIKKEEAEDTYILHMIVDKEYLESKDRVYPVTIDPTVSWTGGSKIYDAYVIGKDPYKDINFYDNGVVVMSAGLGSQGLFRTYLRFTDFTSTLKGKYIDSAKLTLYETGSCSKGKVVEARRVTADWNKSKLTWNNRPGYAATVYSSFTTAGTAGTAKTLDLTKFTRDVANGTNKSYGIMLRTKEETSGTYTQFYGSRHSNVARRPKLTVVYYDGPTSATSVTTTNAYIKKGGKITVKWAGISSKGLSYVQYRVAKYNHSDGSVVSPDYIPYSSSTKIGTTASGSSTIDSSAWPAGCYRIYVRGVDKGGIKGTGIGTTIHIDSTKPAISSAKIVTSSSCTAYSKSSIPKISWTASDAHFSSVWYSVNEGKSYEQISGASASGSFTIPLGVIRSSGTYRVFIKVKDKSGNETKKEAGTYYFDNVVPNITKFTIDTVTGETAYTNNGKPVVSWASTDTTNKVTVAYNINNGSYANISTSLNGSYQVSALSGKAAGKYVIGFRFTDSAGNVTTKTINYYYDPSMPTVSAYKPQNMKASTNLGYKNRISWDISNGTVLHDQISYNIYRSTSQSFTPSASNLIAENVHAQYWYDSMATTGITYYYKVCAVAKNSSGKVLATSGYSDTVKADCTTSLAYFSCRLGSNDYYTYTSFDTPNGSGVIERSTGNFYYTQTDATLPNQQIDFSLTRYFNSQSEYSGMFGNGWDISLNTQLIKKPESESLWFKDTDGKLLEFEKTSDGYKQKSGTDYELIKESASKLELDDAENTVLKIAYEYILTDKSGTKHYFDVSGQSICVVTTTGKYIQYNYNVNGQLVSVVSGSGKRMSFTYAAGTELVSDITLPDETILHYDYESNNLVKASHLSSKKEIVVSYCYSYDSENHLVTIMDAEDNQYSLKYNASGRVISAVYPTGDFLELSYDSKKNKTTSKKKSSDGNELYVENVVYDPNTGYVTEVTDTLGLVTTYVYENNRLKSMTTDSSYQELDDRTVVWKDYSKTTVYTYDENGNIKTKTCSDGEKTEYEYTDKNNESLVTQRKVTDADGIVTQDTIYEYDQDGNITLEKDNISKTEENSKYINSSDGSQTIETTESLVDKEVETSKTTTDADGNTTSSTVTTTGTNAIQTEQSSYDEMGRVVSLVDQKGRKTEYQYDVLGREIMVIYTSGEMKLKEEKSYYPNGQIKQEIAKDGTVTNYTYDALNRLTSKQISKEGITKTWTTAYEYGSVTTYTGKDSETVVQNNVYIEKQRNPEGSVSSVKYTNGKGQVVREQAEGLYSDYVYDHAGKVVVSVLLGQDESDASSRKVTLSLYDKDENQIYTIVNPVYEQGVFKADADKSILSSSTYDASGNVVTSVDGEGNVTTYEYDASGRVTKVVLPSKDTQSYQYDSVGENGIITTKSVNALGYESMVKTDADGRTIETTDVNAKETSIVTKEEYDSEGNKCKTVYSDSSYKMYKYDALLRVQEIQTYTATGEMTGVTKYQYDTSDNVIAMIDYSIADGAKNPLRYTGYTYDLLGKQIEFYEVNGTDAPTNEEKEKAKISYTYDFEGNLESVSYAANKEIQSLHYHYNAYNWLNSITAKRADGKEVPVREYVYHNDGKVQQYKEYTDVLGNSGSYELKKYCYDSFDRVTAMSYYNSESKDQCTENHVYTYDKNSNVVSKCITYAYKELTRTQNTKYAYDSKGQLVKSSVETSEGSTLQTTYEYDAVGNRIKMNQSGIITEYTYNPLNQLLTSKTTDLTGKVTSNITYSYDVKGNQREKTDSVTKEKVSYTYDVQNQLTYVAGTNADGSGYTQTNAYNGNGQRISKIDTSTQVGNTDTTTTVTNYYYQDGTVLYTTNGSETMSTFNLLGQSGNVMGTIRYNSKNEYYVYNKDIQGSTSTIVNVSGEVCAAYYYDDFGTATELLRDKVGNEITYTGAVQDTSTRLYYMNARYYDSETGRFISQDTYRGEQKDAGTWHLYAYCANDPINYADPSGHFAFAIPLVIEGASILIDYVLVTTAACTVYYAADSYRKSKRYSGTKTVNAEVCYNKANTKNRSLKKGPKAKKGSVKLKFPKSPKNFKPKGYTGPKVYETRKNGLIYKWFRKGSNKASFEWDEGLREGGPHWHALGSDGNTRLPDAISGETHIKPGHPFRYNLKQH